jgi:hypothetical protein
MATTDPRIAILSALNDPPYNQTAEKRCVPWDDAAQLLGAYRAAVLREAASAVEQLVAEGEHDPDCLVYELRRMAAANADDSAETQQQAWEAGAARVPENTILEIYEITNDGRPTGWPKFFDRTGEQWEETGEQYDGDVVMMPGGDWVPMLRRDVQAFWGPLVSEEAYGEYLSAVNRRKALVYAAEIGGA